MAFFNNVIAGAAGAASSGSGGTSGFKIERSLRFTSATSSHLNNYFFDGNSKTFTISFWVKRNLLSSDQNLFNASANPGETNAQSPRTEFRFNPTDDKIKFAWNISGSGWVTLETAAAFRDVSAWYHIVVSVDTTQSTGSDRVKIYVNGVQQTLTGSYPASNDDLPYNEPYGHTIGNYANNFNAYLDASLADFYFIDGQALAPTDFGEFDATTGIWNPIAFTGSYGAGRSLGTTSPTVFVSGSNGYGALSDLNTANAVFARNDSNGGFCRLVFHTPVAGVTNIKFRGGSYSVNGNYVFLVNGKKVGGNRTTNSSYSPEVSVDLSPAQDITSIEVRSNTDGYALAAVKFNDTLFTGTPSLGTQGAGVNSFHLDFSDNSSNAALGDDSSDNTANDWAVNNLIAGTDFGIDTACAISSTQTISFPITYATTTTYEFFTRVISAPSYVYFAEHSTNLWNLGLSASNLLFGNFNGGWTTFSNTGLNDGNWHFVRLVTDGTDTSLYIDGSLHATNNSGGSASTGATTNTLKNGPIRVAHLRITTGGTPPTTGIPSISSMNQAAGSGGTLVFYDALDDIAGSGTKTSDGGNVTITMAAQTVAVQNPAKDSLLDSPTNYDDGTNIGGNYCTLNLLHKNTNTTLSNGNLDFYGGGYPAGAVGTVGVSSGKWYYEITPTASPYDPPTIYFGYADVNNFKLPNSGYIYLLSGVYTYCPRGAFKQINGTQTATGFAAGGLHSTFGIALDLDNGTLKIYKDGSLLGTIASNLSGTFAPLVYGDTSSAGDTAYLNFGQRPFAYTPPTDHNGICTQSLGDPLISDGSDHFDIKLYSGNGGGQSIGGTVYTNLLTAPNGFLGSEPASNAFNGDETSRAKASTADDVVTFDLSSLNLTGSFEFWATNASSSYSIDGGVTYTSSNSNNWTTATNDISGVSNIKLKPSSGTTLKVTAFRNNGKHLVNSNGESYEFSPDLIWVKSRTNPNTGHYNHLVDTVRGLSSGFYSTLYSNTNEAEDTYPGSTYGGISEIISDGFVLAKSGSNTHLNNNSTPYVAWAWDGGDFATLDTTNYNQAAWSSTSGTNFSNPAKSFDGSLSTGGIISSSGNTITVTTTPFTGRRIRFYKNGNNDNTTYIYVNGTQYSFPSQTSSTGWVEVDLGSATNVTSLTSSWSPGSYTLYAVEVDGKRLVDTGVVPVGSLNSSVYDQSQTWSNQVTGTPYSGYPITNSFNNNDSTNALPADNNELVFTPSPAFSNASTVKIWYYYPSTNADAFKINGTSVGNDLAQTVSILTHTFNVSGFTSLSWSRNKYGTEDTGIARIDVDGVQLVDNTVSVPDVPSIASTVRANPTAGFSIVSVTAAAHTDGSIAAHGLGAKPEMIIEKRVDSASPWYVQHSALGDMTGSYFKLDQTAAMGTDGTWNLSEPTSLVMSIDPGYLHGSTGADVIYYIFRSVDGYSSFGSYIGNQNTSGDGPFVYTGFRPALVMIKTVTSGQTGWTFVQDTTRDPQNFSDSRLFWGDNYSEVNASGLGGSASYEMDILSNGFKIRNAHNETNILDKTYVYACWAENPFKLSRAR